MKSQGSAQKDSVNETMTLKHYRVLLKVVCHEYIKRLHLLPAGEEVQGQENHSLEVFVEPRLVLQHGLKMA